jgi:PTS system mannose-specific IIC component
VTFPLALALLAWGTMVAVDLVSWPQGLLSRPLVAATVAGAMAGNLGAGLVAGAVLELYALEILPIGASRYPDYGPASVAAGAAAALIPGGSGAGIAGLVGLPLAVLGGLSLHHHRRLTARALEARLGQVNAGDPGAIAALQRLGLLRDAGRGFVLSFAGLTVAWAVHLIPWTSVRHLEWLDVAVIAGGIAAALGGALRSAGQGERRRWLAVGLATGILVVLL